MAARREAGEQPHSLLVEAAVAFEDLQSPSPLRAGEDEGDQTQTYQVPTTRGSCRGCGRGVSKEELIMPQTHLGEVSMYTNAAECHIAEQYLLVLGRGAATTPSPFTPASRGRGRGPANLSQTFAAPKFSHSAPESRSSSPAPSNHRDYMNTAFAKFTSVRCHPLCVLLTTTLAVGV